MTVAPPSLDAACLPPFDADLFLNPRRKLCPADASAALIRQADGRYLMQFRDVLPGVFYPGHWGCFGGALEAGETPREGLMREVQEEIGYRPPQEAITDFTSVTFDFSFCGLGIIHRWYFLIDLPDGVETSLVLGEGFTMKAWALDDLLTCERIVPYDSFALWLLRNQTAFHQAAEN
jgi:8-oxo-dGTP pyrophosphatase MutT (NUDIX family)